MHIEDIDLTLNNHTNYLKYSMTNKIQTLHTVTFLFTTYSFEDKGYL